MYFTEPLQTPAKLFNFSGTTAVQTIVLKIVIYFALHRYRWSSETQKQYAFVDPLCIVQPHGRSSSPALSEPKWPVGGFSGGLSIEETYQNGIRD